MINNIISKEVTLAVSYLAQNLSYFELNNEMKVVLYKDTSRPKVLVQMAYNVGSSAERSDQKGLAHLVEHMIFKGTEKMSESDIDAIARKFGAKYNAFTSPDITSYFFECGKGDWKVFLNIFIDCMKNSAFKSDHLASEVKTVIQELNMYQDDYDTMLAEKSTEAVFAPNHPYHFPIIGFKEELANITAEKLKDFYDKNYMPCKATLFVIGDIDKGEVIQFIKENFGTIENNKHLLQNIEFPKSSGAITSQAINIHCQVEQPKHCFYFKVPGLAEVNDAVVDVLQEILGSGPGSRLYKKLVDATAFAHDASFGVDLVYHGGVAIINVIPHKGSLEQISELIKHEILLILRDGFTETELVKAKMCLSINYLKGLERWQSLTSHCSSDVFLFNDPSKHFTYLERLENVSSKDLQQFVAQNLFVPDLSLVSLVPLTEASSIHWIKQKKQDKQIEEKILSKHKRTSSLEAPKFVHQISKPADFDFSMPRPTFVKTTNDDLHIVMYQKNTTPLAYFRLMFKNSFFLAKNKNGLVLDLMMVTLLEKSKNYSKQENIDYLESLGAHFSIDGDGLNLTCISSNFEKALQRLLEIFLNPDFTKENLEKQKSIMLSEVKELANDPQKVGLQGFWQSLYPNSEFDWNPQNSATRELIEKITLDDLKSLHKKFSSNAECLVGVSGMFNQEEIIKILESNLTVKGEVQKIQYPMPNKQKKDVFFEMLRDQITVFWGNFNDVTCLDQDYPVLSVLNLIVFSGLGSRIFKVRETCGYFYTAFGGLGLDANIFGSINYISTILDPNNYLLAKEKIFDELENVVNNGVSQEELDGAKIIYLNRLVDLFADAASINQIFLALTQFNMGFDYYDKIIKTVKSLTVEDLNLAAKKYLKPDDFSEILVGKLLEQHVFNKQQQISNE